MDYETIYLLLRRSHIAVGMVGIVAFWIPVMAKKGGRAHIVAGRVFEWCGYYVASTALFACARNLLTAHDFAFVQRPDASAEELARIRFVQFFLTLLAFLAWIFLVQLRNGMRVVRTRHQSAEVYQNWEATWWLYSQAAGSVALIAYGAFRLIQGYENYHWISVVIGLIPLMELKRERQFLLAPKAETMAWWLKHMECMLGCGIAFHTAGLVFLSRWIERNWGLGLEGSLQLIPWALPTAIGVPISNRWLGRYRKKFGMRAPAEKQVADVDVA